MPKTFTLAKFDYSSIQFLPKSLRKGLKPNMSHQVTKTLLLIEVTIAACSNKRAVKRLLKIYIMSLKGMEIVVKMPLLYMCLHSFQNQASCKKLLNFYMKDKY